jgi:uncharacterized protein YnzC (UPF0291/DUF896 family)
LKEQTELAARKKARVTPNVRRGAKLKAPDWTGWETWTGDTYHRFKGNAHRWYYDNYQAADLMPAVWTWMENNGYSKEDIAKCKAAPSYTISSTAAIICNMLLLGMPDYNKVHDEYWQTLPGTSGNVKPASEFIKKRIEEALTRGEKVIEEKKEEEEKAKVLEKYVPTIQQRMREQATLMSEFIEQAFDDFTEEKITDFKGIEITRQLRALGCKQPHARLISGDYTPLLAEYKELLNPPSTAKMTDEEKDYAQQLKDGYAHYDKKQIKKLHDFIVSVVSSCDAIIAESKATRKPRKLHKKAPEQLVKKMKYKISDEKYAVSSVPPEKIVGANCLVVFNSKTRKLGIYYTSVEDPTGVGRDGSGLNVKGTTLERFNDETSVSYTLRKPMEQLQEVKTLNTRKKFENWLSKLTTTPVKMNGRINPETILINTY